MAGVLPDRPLIVINYKEGSTQLEDCAAAISNFKRTSCSRKLSGAVAVFGRENPQNVSLCSCEGAPFDVPALARHARKIPPFLMQELNSAPLSPSLL